MFYVNDKAFETYAAADKYRRSLVPAITRRCAWCDEIFAIEGKSRRKDRVFCSLRCKVARHRHKHRNNALMAHFEASVGELAAAMGFAPEAVIKLIESVLESHDREGGAK